jgi:hypothetical protein
MITLPDTTGSHFEQLFYTVLVTSLISNIRGSTTDKNRTHVSMKFLSGNDLIYKFPKLWYFVVISK